jgi:hypothetical protein
MRWLAISETTDPASLASLREKLIKIGAKVVSHGRYLIFQLAEVAVSRQMFADILMLLAQAADTAESDQKMGSDQKHGDGRTSSTPRHSSCRLISTVSPNRG